MPQQATPHGTTICFSSGFVNNHYSNCLVTNARNYTFHLACKLTENIIHQHYKCLLLKEQESILFVIVETHLSSKDPKYITLPGHVYQQLSMFITKSCLYDDSSASMLIVQNRGQVLYLF